MTASASTPVAPSPLTPADESKRATGRPVVMRHRLEYAALRAAIAAFGTLGFKRASDLGARLGLLGYRPFGIRRRVVERQIQAAFPEWNHERVEATARAAYENLGRTTVETALLSRLSRQEFLDLVDCPTWDVVDRANAKGKGVILFSGHFGNWELGGAYVGARGIHIECVARQQENPLFDAYVTRARERNYMPVIYDGDAVRRVPRLLRQGGTAALVADQGAAGLASTWVPFFGRLAKTARGGGTFALRFQAPVVFIAALRKPDGRFTINFEDIPVHETGDKSADVDRIIADYTAALERWVRKAPEQYFWHHRRWKHQQPGTPPELGNPLA
jgi:KDO2-lipid IV(A) lauroyltransferase